MIVDFSIILCLLLFYIQGYTALHIAAIHNKESLMQFLIQDYSKNMFWLILT